MDGKKIDKKVMLVLDEFLKEKEMTRYELSKLSEIGYQTIDKYYKNKVVRYDSYILLKICTVLDCEVGDILKIR